MAEPQKQNKLQRKHAIEKMELDMLHAQEWVDFYTKEEQPDLAESWAKELRRRQINFLRATQTS